MAQDFSVINNLTSSKAQRNLHASQMDMQKTLKRLSSGMRLNDASDDAAGISIANALNADVTALSQAVRNANDGVGIVQVADGALSRISDMLAQASSMATQAASGTLGSNERNMLNTQYQQILQEIDRVTGTTNFKGERLFAPDQAMRKNIYVGDTQINSTLAISIGGTQGAGTQAMGLSGSSLATPEAAVDTLQRLQSALSDTNRWRGALGAQQNRLINAVSIIQTQSINLRAASSVIQDANMAEEATNLTRARILGESGMASLAQANASSRMILQLFGQR